MIELAPGIIHAEQHRGQNYSRYRALVLEKIHATYSPPLSCAGSAPPLIPVMSVYTELTEYEAHE